MIDSFEYVCQFMVPLILQILFTLQKSTSLLRIRGWIKAANKNERWKPVRFCQTEMLFQKLASSTDCFIGFFCEFSVVTF